MSDKKNDFNNPVIEAIYNRRSVRDFQEKPVPKNLIKAVIDAGNQAPFTSEKLTQPWRFVVVTDLDFKNTLVQTAVPVWKRSLDGMKDFMPEIYDSAMKLYDSLDDPKDMVYYSAPVIIFVIAPSRNNTCAALACENMMIAATSLGLGSCYVGFGAMVGGNPDVMKSLEISDDERIFGPILLGYRKKDSEAKIAKGLAHLAPVKKDPVVKWI